MGRAPCCEKEGLKKGPWTPEEDKILVDYIQSNGHGSWRSLPKLAGLLRCGKSCRLRWTNYLRPDIKRGPFTADEQKSIIQLHGIVGNKWSTIAAQLPGRTDNEVKNYWNTHLKKRLLKMGIDPDTFTPATAGVATASPSSPGSSSSHASAAATRHMAQWESARLEAEARLAKESLVFSTTTTATSTSDAVVGEQQHDAPGKPETDFFLRIWNSEVGRAFRSKERAVVDSSSSSPAASSTKCKNGKEEEVVECKDCGCDGGSSEEVIDEASSECYQLYLDFADDIGMGSLFNGQFGSFSLFGGDMTMNMNITDDSSLDDAFKWPEVEKTRV